MEAQSVSKLQFYSLGLVSANKILSSKDIEVTPVEDFPMLDGEITDHIDLYKATSKDAAGSTTKVQIDTTASVKATWLPISNSNRRTPPDVRRGETVVLYKFSDTDKFWWNTLFNDSRLRRLETVIYAFSDNAEENVEDTATSTYFLEVSTHRKIIHLHTSKSDKEPFIYDVQINAKEGVITITDDAGNYFILNSRDTRLTMRNGDGSIVDIDKTNITLSSTDSITLKSKNIHVLSEKNTTVKSGKITSISSEKNKISGGAELNDTVSIEGYATLTGGISLSNAGGAAGSIDGDFNINGVINVESLVSSNPIIAPGL